MLSFAFPGLELGFGGPFGDLDLLNNKVPHKRARSRVKKGSFLGVSPILPSNLVGIMGVLEGFGYEAAAVHSDKVHSTINAWAFGQCSFDKPRSGACPCTRTAS